MSSEEAKACKEKPSTEVEEAKSKRVLVFLAAALAVTLAVAGSLALAASGLPLGFNIPFTETRATVSALLFYAVVIPAALYTGFIGLRELLVERRFSVEFLMAVAALGATYLGSLLEAATVLLLYYIAEYFENFLEERARRTVEKLSRFMPDKARLIANGVEKIIDVSDVAVGSTLLVKPGERIPLDGNVVEGVSNVDQALVTGESTPILRSVNDCVYAGTMATSGVLKIVVTKRSDETLVSRIVQLVTESSKRKATMEKLVDRFARVYVPIVIALAVAVTVVPTLLVGGFEGWFYRSLVLLVVSCPSAFIISVPATIFVAITIAAKRGVIIKGGVYVEKLNRVRKVVFDKTGTLTLGKPAVHEIRNVEHPREDALAFAAALDQFSNHPVAKAIVRRAVERGVDISKLKVTDVTEVPGKGIVGSVNGNFVAVGNPELMREFGCNCEEAYAISEKDVHTSVCISIGKEGLASVCVVDEIREDALKSITSLKQRGVETAMLTGDRPEIAKETAGDLQIQEYYAGLFPEDKLQCIQDMKAKAGDGLVAMVGDGVNDAPALAASDVGIAMGAAGVDVALESADVVLVRDELAQIPYLLRLSEKTMQIAKQNIVASLVIKLVLGALGVAGVTGLLATVVAGDDGVTMLLLLNTLRLERVK